MLGYKQVENAEKVVDRVEDDKDPLPSKTAPGPPGRKVRVCQWADGTLHPGPKNQVLVEGEHEGHRGHERRTEAKKRQRDLDE